MSKIELFVIVFFLIFIIIGYVKGFFKQLLSFANWIIALIASYIFVRPLSNYLKTTTISSNMNQKLTEWISSKGELFTTPINTSQGTDQLVNAISELGLPKFIGNLIVDKIDMTSVGDGSTLSDVLAPSIGSILITIIAFIGIFILSIILIKIIVNILNNVFDVGILGFINRLLGALLGAVKAFVFVSLIMLIVSILSGIVPSINNYMVGELSKSDGFTISKYIYENNPLVWLFKNSIKF